jgi:hypothetical protein
MSVLDQAKTDFAHEQQLMDDKAGVGESTYAIPRFQIRQAENTFSGAPMFHLYEWDGAIKRWAYRTGSANLDEVRKAAQRIKCPKPEVIVESFS